MANRNHDPKKTHEIALSGLLFALAMALSFIEGTLVIPGLAPGMKLGLANIVVMYALLLVTHDRHLMNSLACPILYLEDGKAVIYPSYDALMGRAAPAPVAEKSSEPAKAGYGKEQRRRRAELRAKIKACEDEMEACGAREVELENEINSPEVYNDPQLLREKSDELSDLRFHQDELFAAWEAAVEEQEQYEQTAGGEE